MKGRIIGREGRNIRALEHLTGVRRDHRRHARRRSCSPPSTAIRREVAKLDADEADRGRSHPSRAGSRRCITSRRRRCEEHVRQAGEQAVFEANCGDFHQELVKILGRLRFRTSYGQNVLKHYARGRAPRGDHGRGARGEREDRARRAALLHDLGKALTHEVEGHTRSSRPNTLAATASRPRSCTRSRRITTRSSRRRSRPCS